MPIKIYKKSYFNILDRAVMFSDKMRGTVWYGYPIKVWAKKSIINDLFVICYHLINCIIFT